MRFKKLFQYAIRNPGAVIPFLITLPRQARLIARLLGDSRVDVLPKLVFVASLVYLVSPIDLIPDFLFPVLGWTDDIVVVFAAARFLFRHCPPEVLNEHMQIVMG